MSPADRKSEILTLAEELLQTRGYSGFSYADLARELAVSKAAIHHHFATKEDLGLALVEHYQQELLDAHRQIDAHAADAGQALELLVEAAAEKLVQGCKVCPSGIFEAEQGAVPESLAAAARRLDESMHEWLAGLLTRGRARGELAFVGEVQGGISQSPPQKRAIPIVDFPFLAGGEIGGWKSPDMLGWLEERQWFLIGDAAGMFRGLVGGVSLASLLALSMGMCRTVRSLSP